MQRLAEQWQAVLESGFFRYELLGNSIGRYAAALVAFAALYGLFGVFSRRAIARLETLSKRTETQFDDALIEIVRAIKPPFYTFLALFFAAKFLALTAFLDKLLNVFLIVLLVYQAIRALQIFINYVVRERFGGNSEARTSAGVLGFLTKLVLWAVGLLLILSNLGIDVTSLIAGLGIGGVAVALAVQNILGDLFSSFALQFDKPFVPGDFIIVGDKMGVVEKIGIKTTRIRALQGEEIIFSNRELTNAVIQNFKRMQQRRIAFSFGVVYETPLEKLRRIPELVKESVGREPNARFDRSNFQKFGDSALLFENVYYLKTPDYNEYMNTQERINLGIFASFEQEGIALAYPTQTLYVRQVRDSMPSRVV